MAAVIGVIDASRAESRFLDALQRRPSGEDGQPQTHGRRTGRPGQEAITKVRHPFLRKNRPPPDRSSGAGHQVIPQRTVKLGIEPELERTLPRRAIEVLSPTIVKRARPLSRPLESLPLRGKSSSPRDHDDFTRDLSEGQMPADDELWADQGGYESGRPDVIDEMESPPRLRSVDEELTEVVSILRQTPQIFGRKEDFETQDKIADSLIHGEIQDFPEDKFCHKHRASKESVLNSSESKVELLTARPNNVDSWDKAGVHAINGRRGWFPNPPHGMRRSLLVKDTRERLRNGKAMQPRRPDGARPQIFNIIEIQKVNTCGQMMAKESSTPSREVPRKPKENTKIEVVPSAPRQHPQSRPQTSIRTKCPMTADQIVGFAFKAAAGSHIPPVATIFPSARLDDVTTREEPILQDAKRVEMQDKKLQQQSSKQGLHLQNLAVDWTDWTTPNVVLRRQHPIHVRPRTSRTAASTPRLQESHRSHSSQPAVSAISRSIWSGDAHGKGELGWNRFQQGPAVHRNDLDKDLLQEWQRQNMRPQTSENNRTAKVLSVKNVAGGNIRPATSEMAMRPRIASGQLKLAQSRPVQDEDGDNGSLMACTSLRKASDLWRNIVNEALVTDKLVEPDSGPASSSIQKTGLADGRHFHELGQATIKGELNSGASESSDKSGVVSSSGIRCELDWDWIGSEEYHEYIEEVETLVSGKSQENLVLEQNERVRKILPNNIKHQEQTSKGRIVSSPQSILRTGSTSSSSLPSAHDTKQSALQASLKARNDRLALQASAEARKEAQHQMIKDLDVFLKTKIGSLKWGDRDAPASEAGLAELIQLMDDYNDKTVPEKTKWMDKDFKGFLESQKHIRVRQLLSEGRSHSAATMEEAKCYISAFYTNSMDQFTDENTFVTKTWTGLKQDDIMQHAEFYRDIEYVKRKGHDLMAEFGKEARVATVRKKKKDLSDDQRKLVREASTAPGGSHGFVRVRSTAGGSNGFVRVSILEADNLPCISKSKKSTDTYVRCEIRTENEEYKRGDKKFVARTNIEWDNASPSWRTEFEFSIPDATDDVLLVLSVVDVDFGEDASEQLADTLVGTIEIPIFNQGYQTIIAEQATTEWHNIYDAGEHQVVSNRRECLGRPSTLKVSHVFTRKLRMSFLKSAHVLQTAYRCRLARAKFEKQRRIKDGYLNRHALNPQIVGKLDAEFYWNEYARFCREEGAIFLSECKRQFEHKQTFRLSDQYLSFHGVCALSRVYEIYPPGVLRSLEVSYAGINSPSLVTLSNAIVVGCTALESLVLDGNPLNSETNKVTQANNPITNRLGRGLSGCRALAQMINIMPNLNRLSLAGSRLGDQGLAEIARAMQSNSSIEVLNISDTNDAQPGAMPHASTEVGKMLSQNDNLYEFHCSSVNFPGLSALALLGAGKFKTSGLRFNRSLRVIDLSRNNLCRSIVANRALSEYLRSDTCCVEHMDLGYNHMDQYGVMVFCDGLIGNRSLQKVILDGNDLGVVGCRTVLSCRGRKTVLATSNVGKAEEITSRRHNSKSEVRRVFEKFDQDHSGTMDVQEMEEFLESLNNAEALGDAASIVKAIDTDESGVIEFEEFYDWYMDALRIEDDGEKKLEISLEDCRAQVMGKVFDPSDPNGNYRLDMSQPTSRSTLLCMMQLVFSGKAEFLPGSMTIVNEGEEDETARTYDLLIPEDPSEWVVPEVGVLAFEFGLLRPTAGVNDVVGSFIMNYLREGFAKPSPSTRAERDELLDVCTGEDAFFSYKQVIELLDILTKSAETDNERKASLEEERVALVTRVFLRLVDRKKNQSKLLDHLNPQEKRQVEENLGIAAYSFDPENATGHHKLDLSFRSQREVMMRLIEIRNSQRSDVKRWKSHLNRGNGSRDDLEIVFRNLTYNGEPLVYTTSWRIPERGLVEVDFVEIRKPDVQTAVEIEKIGWSNLLALLHEPNMRPIQIVEQIRTFANKSFLTCLHLWQLLCLFDKYKPDESACRVEVAVACFARVLDWRALRRVFIMEFLPAELASVEYRLGKVNIYFDEVASPVGYWELDLSDPEDRWLTQELVYLAAEEPGYNVIQAKMDVMAAPGSLQNDNYRFDGIDFTIPAAWINYVPTAGVLKLFYARTAKINYNYVQHGTWNGKTTPLLKPSTKSIPPRFVVPAVANDYDEQRDGIRNIWVYIEKIRVIKAALLKVTDSAKTMFTLLDTSGDGDLQRKELTLGLFRIGVWLTPVEAEMLLEVVDVDGSGEIDLGEFQAFWSNAPPFRYGDEEQRSYWTPRRCTEEIYTVMLHFYDIRMCYSESDLKAFFSASKEHQSKNADSLMISQQLEDVRGQLMADSLKSIHARIDEFATSREPSAHDEVV